MTFGPTQTEDLRCDECGALFACSLTMVSAAPAHMRVEHVVIREEIAHQLLVFQNSGNVLAVG